jgi:hypothetical protein
MPSLLTEFFYMLIIMPLLSLQTVVFAWWLARLSLTDNYTCKNMYQIQYNKHNVHLCRTGNNTSLISTYWNFSDLPADTILPYHWMTRPLACLPSPPQDMLAPKIWWQMPEHDSTLTRNEQLWCVYETCISSTQKSSCHNATVLSSVTELV